MKKLAAAVALCGAFLASPVEAKTFVGVLWPMFGPLPAIGLVELVAELKMMPDVEVETYVHQAWPSLVDDLERQPPGTHTVVVGYSLGANSTVFVANNSKYVDLIVALQPSMLSWNPPLTGKVGRMIEIYNPNPWMTFGGMGSKKLEGDNIEYIANNDSHPGAQFNSEFRILVKTEIAKFTAQDRQQTAQAAAPVELAFAEERPASQQKDVAANGHSQVAQTELPKLAKPAAPDRVAQTELPKVAKPATPDRVAQTELPKVAKPATPDRVAQIELPKVPKSVAPERAAQERAKAEPKDQPRDKPKDESRNGPKNDSGAWVAFLDGLSNSVNAGDLSGARELTPADMMDYAKRTYGVSATANAANGIERVEWVERQ